MSVSTPRTEAPPSAADDASAAGGRSRRRRLVWAAAAAFVVLLVATSNLYGRAEPTGRYRPDLPADALASGCYPLPSGVRLDFPHQVRSDEDLSGGRRHLLLQFDDIDTTTARAEVTAAFAAAGFRPSPAGDADTDLVLVRDGAGRPPATVGVTVRPIPGVGPDAVVRGTIDLDLPSVPLSSAAAMCAEPSVTKRFTDQAGAS